MARLKASAKARLAKNPLDLGKIASERRQQFGVSIRKAAPMAGVGVRFLTEFENGKPTAELGKVMNALHAAGLDLAVVERDQPGYGDMCISQRPQPLSAKVGTEFPYDWSNSNLDERIFIRKVLEASRFNDVLHTVSYFGYDRVAEEITCLKNISMANKVISMLTRIQKGLLQAKCQVSAEETGNAVS